ncbi:MAG TPA: glycosyltransferase family 2 protein [Allosphingosinicella sp.]
MSNPVPAAAPANERILLFVPMYNCEAQIPRVVAQLTALRDLPQEFGILCVDNRSTDDTVEAARNALAVSAPARWYLLRNDDNYGLGGSHKVGFEFARRNGYDHVIVLHGDDQGSVDDLLPLIARGEHRRVDALLGARFQPGARLMGYSALRTFANRAFNLVFSGVAGKRFYDLGSGLNMFRTAMFDDGFHLRYADDLTFNYYLVFGLADHEFSLRFFPIKWREDDQVSNAKLFSQGMRMLRLLRQRVTSRRRFHAAEHRDVPRASYPSTLIAEGQGPGSARTP